MVYPVSERCKEVLCKTVLGSQRILDTRFWTKYCFDPYVNCGLNCTYCNTAAKKYHDLKDFYIPVSAKVNAPQILARELKNIKRKGVLSMGAATDIYQPAEEEYRITRQILEVLATHHFPFSFGTKSDLVLRDIDLISSIAETTHCCVSISLSTLDADLAKLFEPNAPPPKRRLEVLKKLSNAGVPTGAWLAPIFPGITDNEESMTKTIQAIADTGSKFVLGAVFDMRNPVGFKKLLAENYAELVPKYERIYQKGRPCSYPSDEHYLFNLYKEFISVCDKCQVENYSPHLNTREQAIAFFMQNFFKFNNSPLFELTQIFNYFYLSQEFLQTIRLRFGDWRISKGFLKAVGYFPH